MVEAQERAKSVMESQKGKAVSGLDNMAQTFRQLSGEMRQKDMESVSRYTEVAADRIEQLSGYLRNKNMNDLINEAEDIARRQPAVFIGGAFMVGLLMARFLKSSGRYSSMRSPYRYETEPYRYGGTSDERYAYGEEPAGGYRRDIPVREET